MLSLALAPIAAAAGAPRALAMVVTALSVAAEPWALALLGVALYSWLEREVRGVVEVALPLALALGAVAGVSEVVHLGVSTLGSAAPALAARASHLFPGPHVLALATFVGYSLLAYRRRAVAPVTLAALASAGVAGRYGGGALVAGAACGVVLAGGAYAAAVRLAGRSSLAVRRGGVPDADRDRPAA